MLIMRSIRRFTMWNSYCSRTNEGHDQGGGKYACLCITAGRDSGEKGRTGVAAKSGGTGMYGSWNRGEKPCKKVPYGIRRMAVIGAGLYAALYV